MEIVEIFAQLATRSGKKQHKRAQKKITQIAPLEPRLFVVDERKFKTQERKSKTEELQALDRVV